MPQAPKKTYWLGAEFNRDFDAYYFDQTLSAEAKEHLFTDRLYPNFRKLAVSLISPSNYDKSTGLSKDELIDECVLHAHNIAPKYRADRKAARSSFLLFCMQRYVRGLYKKRQNKCHFLFTTTPEHSHWQNEDEEAPMPCRVSLPAEPSDTTDQKFVALLNTFWEQADQRIQGIAANYIHMAQQIHAVLQEYGDYYRVYVKPRLRKYGNYYVYRQGLYCFTQVNRKLHAHYLEHGELPATVQAKRMTKIRGIGDLLVPRSMLVWQRKEKPRKAANCNIMRLHDNRFRVYLTFGKRRINSYFANLEEAHAYVQEMKDSFHVTAA